MGHINNVTVYTHKQDQLEATFAEPRTQTELKVATESKLSGRVALQDSLMNANNYTIEKEMRMQ